jgi:hypothetical protein
VQEHLRRTHELLIWVNEVLANARIASSDAQPLAQKIPVAVGCFHQVIEHGFAIERLYGNPPFYGSAFALVRPMFEGLVRGLWMLHCATPAQARKFVETDEIDQKLEVLIKQVEIQHPGFSGGSLSRVKEGPWRKLASHVYSGASQLKRRIAENEIRPDYDEAARNEVLGFVRVFALFAAFELSALSNRTDLTKQMLTRLQAEC